jgi:hypothetical protein
VLSQTFGTTLRTGVGILIGVVFTLFAASGFYLGARSAVIVMCTGAVIGGYAAFRYGDRFIVWVLKSWSQPGD